MTNEPFTVAVSFFARHAALRHVCERICMLMTGLLENKMIIQLAVTLATLCIFIQSVAVLGIGSSERYEQEGKELLWGTFYC